MKWTSGLFLLELTVCTGCVSLPISWPGEKAPSAPAAAVKIAAPPVTAEDVNEDNANEKAQALREELEHDAHSENCLPGKP